MKIKSYKHIIIFVLFFIFTVWAYVWFAYSPYYQTFVDWALGNLYIFYPLMIVIKAIGIIWPPIPGAVLTIGSIWIIGWIPAYLADFTGSMIGSTIAYYLAKRWGYPILGKILDKKTIDKIRQVKVKKGKELEAIFLFRFFGGTILEIVCYAAGVLNIRYKQFILGSMLSHLLTGIPTFYFVDKITRGNHILINSILLIIAVIIFVFFRKRYFSTQTKL
jgi:uncharacterized membrane protein YdjX (TVP38/TMEM64 family)